MTPNRRHRSELRDAISIREADRELEMLNAGTPTRAPKAHVAAPVAAPVAPLASGKTSLLPASGRTRDLTPLADIGLPALLAEIAEVAGLDVALKLAADRGGNRVYIPARAGDGHWLVQLVGRQPADLIMAHFSTDGGGIELALPRGPTGAWAGIKLQLAAMIRAGATSTEITRTLGISRDMVKAHRARLRCEAASGQLSLLDLIVPPEAGEARAALPKPDEPSAGAGAERAPEAPTK